MKVERENTKTGWESEVLLQIPLCSLSPIASINAKLQKRGGENMQPLCSFPALKPRGKRLQFIPKSFRYKAVSLPIIRADRKIWL